MTSTDPRKLDRYEAPNYLARYRQRQGGAPTGNGAAVSEPDSTPLYLRRFRERGSRTAAPEPPLVEFEGATFTPALAEATRGKAKAAKSQKPVKAGKVPKPTKPSKPPKPPKPPKADKVAKAGRAAKSKALDLVSNPVVAE